MPPQDPPPKSRQPEPPMHSRDDIPALSLRQAAFARAVSSADGIWPDDLLAGVIPGGTLDAAAALAVYRNGYFARLTEQLGETYRTIWRALGDETFFLLCAAYIRTHPSTSYNLSEYGREFAEFLATTPEAADAVFLPELARFELAFHDLFHAPAHEPLDAAALAAIGDLTGVRLHFGSAVRLMACGHAVRDLFGHRHDPDDAEPPQLDIDRPQWIVMCKRGTDVVLEEIGRSAFVTLEALARGVSIDEALDEAATVDPEFSAADVSRLFETIALCGLVTGWSR